MSKFSERLESLLKEKKLSKLEFERLTGIDNSLMCKYVAGYYEPGVENLTIIADFFDCSIDFLCGLDPLYNRYKNVSKPNVDKFIKRYLELLKDKKSNFHKISKDLNFARHSSTRWQQQKIFPVLSILIKLAQYFNVPLEYLIGRVDDFKLD